MRNNYESQDSSQQSLIETINVNQEMNSSNVRIICKVNAAKHDRQKLNKRSSSVSSNGPQQFNQKQKIDFNPAQAFVLKNLMTPIPETRKGTKSPNVRSKITRSKSRDSRHDESPDSCMKQEGQLPDSRYSVFTTIEQSNLVVVSELPVKGSVIQEKLLDAKDLQHFVVFMFDSVRNELQRQDRFYVNEIRPTVRRFIQGDNGCVLFFGPSGGGKSFAMQGKAGANRGVVPRAVEEILTLIGMGDADFDGGFSRDSKQAIGRIYLMASVYMVHCESSYDLLHKGQSARKCKIDSFVCEGSTEVTTQLVGLTQQVILNLEQYYNMMQDAFKERRVLSSRLSDHDLRKRSHFVVQFSLARKLKSSFEEMQRLNFVELAGSEQSVSQPETFIRDTSIRQFITKSFNSLSVQILKVSTKKYSGGEEAESTLVNCLQKTLQSNSSITVVNCCSPNQSQYLHTLPAIKFCARIRDTIVRRLNRKEKKGVCDYINGLQQELQSLDQNKDRSKTEVNSWCTKNLELIGKALQDCRKSGKSDVADSLEYYWSRIAEVQRRYQPDQFYIGDKERPKRGEALPLSNEILTDEDCGPISYRSKKSDVAHPRCKSDVVSLPAHLKSLIEYKSTQRLSEMQEKFLSSQKIKDLIGGVSKPQQQLYESSEQTLQDIQRLILLEDFSGLKRRVVALSKERLSCNDVINCQTIEIEELRMQLDARNDLVRGVTQLTEQNVRECTQQIKQWEDQQWQKEQDTQKQITSLEFTLSHTVTQFEEMKRIKEESEMRLKNALRDVDEQKEKKILAETKLKEVSDQNDKIMLNYEVLKEHELSIIKDCSNKQKESKQILATKLNQLEQVITAKDLQAAQLQQQIRDLGDQVRALKFEVHRRDERDRIQCEHMNILECKIERQQRDSDELQGTIAKMKREIQAKDDTVMELVKDRKEAMNEILQLQNLVKSFENQCQAQDEGIREKDNKLKALMAECGQLRDAKGMADECIRLNNKDLEAIEMKFKTAEEEVKKVTENYRQLERANLRIKANEYDKVDVMRRNIELESTIKSLKQELEDVVSERNKTRKIGDARQDENQVLVEQNKKMAQEIESMKRTHENTLNSFDKKFTDFSNELMILANQNTQLKEAEKTFKRRAHVLELENVEWREKCKYLEMRHYDSSIKPDIRTTPEGPKMVTMKEILEIKQEAQDDAFGDIKSLIHNFKKERELQRETKIIQQSKRNGLLKPQSEEN